MGPCPPEFDISNLTPINVHQIVHWDETHVTQCIGATPMGCQRRQLLFRRDDDGRIDLENGAYQEACRQRQLKMKYLKESRFSLGCAAVKLPCGAVIGRRCEPYIYTNKWMLNVAEWDQAVATEIARVKALPATDNEWVTGQRDYKTSDLYMGDDMAV